MKNKIAQIIIFLISVITSIVSYSYLPESVASHWNYKGEVDAYSSKLSNLIAFPALILFMYVLLTIVPKLDPMNENIKKFEDDFHRIITIFMGFFLIIQYQVILWSMGVQISPNILFPILLAGLFYFVGTLLEKAKRNWTIGIRTAWTLSSDAVWDKTHKLGALLFKLVAPISILSIIFPSWSFMIVIGYILTITVVTVVYSYIVYKQEKA